MSKFAVATGLSLAVLTALTPARADEQGVTATEIKVGAFGPFAGPAYLYGKIAMNGIQVVFDKANEAGGINGRKLVLVREDDSCKAEGAIAAVKKLTSVEGVFALLGGACSNSTLAARPEIEKSGVPFILNSATADAITAPVVKNIYASQSPATVESIQQLDFALKHGGKKIALVVMKDAWGTARYEPFMKYVKEKGVELVANLELAPDASDATAQALQLQTAGADAVIAILYPKPAAVMVRDAVKIGYKPMWVGNGTISDVAAFDKQVGIPGALDTFTTITSTRWDPTDPALAVWYDRLKKAYPNDEPSPYAMYGLGSAQVLVEALRLAGPDLTREKLLTALGSLKDFKSDAYYGLITCHDPVNHQCNQSVGWMSFKNGKTTELQ
jgi:branched-chain amino acid transport system substrate-binding protein